jgi:hypothetical protein
MAASARAWDGLHDGRGDADYLVRQLPAVGQSVQLFGEREGRDFISGLSGMGIRTDHTPPSSFGMLPAPKPKSMGAL